MNPNTSKWQPVSEEVMKCGFSPCPRDGPACKMKWNQIIPNYKWIADFFFALAEMEQIIGFLQQQNEKAKDSHVHFLKTSSTKYTSGTEADQAL